MKTGFFLLAAVSSLSLSGSEVRLRIVDETHTPLMGDFSLNGLGGVNFTYYFNPVPNDRNLEFDPKKNLFPASLPSTKVDDP